MGVFPPYDGGGGGYVKFGSDCYEKNKKFNKIIIQFFLKRPKQKRICRQKMSVREISAKSIELRPTTQSQ